MFGLFKKKKTESGTVKIPKGFYEVTVSQVEKLTPNSVQVSFEIPKELTNEFYFVPGQYINICTEIDGAEERRSYSICSGPGEVLSIAAKEVENGKVSKWMNNQLAAGDKVYISAPMGNFILEDPSRKIIAFAAGSGITPVLSIAKSIAKSEGQLKLFYGNRNRESIMFGEELKELKNTEVVNYLSADTAEGCFSGRLDKEAILSIFKSDLSNLRADGYYLCGPEAMVEAATEVLNMFGVGKQKIHFELYTTPVAMEPVTETNSSASFSGTSQVKVILDDEEIEFELEAGGRTILDAANKEGLDAPYSCRGGVCCTCRAKVLEGKAVMKLNYSLTDDEIEKGYILTCQATPVSEKIVVSYDA